MANEKSDIRLALVEYRDHPPQESSFITRVLDFTPSVSKMKKRLDACSASGGNRYYRSLHIYELCILYMCIIYCNYILPVLALFMMKMLRTCIL